jgi:hypothetical protein
MYSVLDSEFGNGEFCRTKSAWTLAFASALICLGIFGFPSSYMRIDSLYIDGIDQLFQDLSLRAL